MAFMNNFLSWATFTLSAQVKVLAVTGKVCIENVSFVSYPGILSEAKSYWSPILQSYFPIVCLMSTGKCVVIFFADLQSANTHLSLFLYHIVINAFKEIAQMCFTSESSLNQDN